MTPRPVTLAEDASVRAAARTLFAAHVGGAPVVDGNGRLVGVVSERDLLEKEAHSQLRWRGGADAARRLAATTVGQICTRPARTTTPDQTLHQVARQMIDEHIARLVVTDGDDIVGIVTRHDVLRALLRDDDELAGAVRDAVRRQSVDQITIDVHEGVVTLRGVVPRRSQHGDLLGTVELVDGVLDIDDRVVWDSDDITPRAPHPHP